MSEYVAMMIYFLGKCFTGTISSFPRVTKSNRPIPNKDAIMLFLRALTLRWGFL